MKLILSAVFGLMISGMAFAEGALPQADEWLDLEVVEGVLTMEQAFGFEEGAQASEGTLLEGSEGLQEMSHYGRQPRHPRHPDYRPPRRRPPRHRPRPVPPGPRQPRSEYVCYAENYRGMEFSARGVWPDWTQERAMDYCYARSRRCYPLGCRRIW